MIPHLVLIQVKNPSSEKVNIDSQWSQNSRLPHALYIHSKGVVSASASVSNWREILNHFCITEWPNCIKQLETADVVGIKDITTSNDIISGNFWWSKSSHIVKLLDPLDTSRYVTDVNLHPSGPAYRYGFEKWILQHSPKIHHLVDTATDHFDNYCFLENVN